MFKLFKKAFTPKVNEQAIIAEIHNEFDSAGERLINEAKLIIEGKADFYDKAERLLGVGFKNSIEVTGAEHFRSIKEWPQLITSYQQKYPFNKFITHEAAIAICKKYGLVLGDASMYKGTIPNVKLQEIERSKIDVEDKVVAFVVNDDNEPIRGLIAKDFNTDYTKSCLRSKNYFYVSTDAEFRKHNNLFGMSTYAKINFDMACLKICAPIKEMIIPKGKQVKNHTIVDVPDPIVLQPVKGGYLIVSKWGLEASDSSLTNEKLN